MLNVRKERGKRRSTRKSKRPTADHLPRATGAKHIAAVALGLAFFTVLTFLPVRHFEFVNYDDLEFVVENPHIATGLTAANLRWIFQNPFAATGGPVTWLSHLLDVEMFGLDAGMHHVTSLTLHAANAALLLAVLWWMTGALGRSLFVSALFALHPLHVESVAWVAQRKDVVSTLFWLLTMWAYARYVRRPGMRRYVLVGILLALGLMSKPMLVTLPFVLLLMDFWPLERVSFERLDRKRLQPLIVEKVPLMAMSAIAIALAWSSQRALGAVTEFDALPLSLRVSNALVSYVAYMGKMLWPVGLVPYYPYREAVGLPVVAGCALLLTAVTGAAVVAWRRAPYVTCGWFWFVGTLVPVIGLVQVGGHAMADRSTYVPLIGLFIAVAWSGTAALRRAGLPSAVVAGAAACVVLACGITARAQTWHWRNSIALWEHTTRVTPDSARAQANLGVALAREGKIDAAIERYEESLRLRPSAEAHNNLALALARRGRNADAIGHAFAAVNVKPGYVNARSNLAGLLAAQGRKDEAIEQYSKVIQAQPDHVLARVGLALSLLETKRAPDAVPHILEAIRLQPGDARWRHVAGLALLDIGRRAEAATHFEAALRLDPSHQGARRALDEMSQRRE